MTELQNRAIRFIQILPNDKLENVINYILELIEDDPQGSPPLDDFDYELSRRADKAIANGDTETFSFDEVLKEAGLTYDDIRNPI